MVSPVIVGVANGQSGQGGDGMEKTPKTNAVFADVDCTAPVRVSTQKVVADDRSSREKCAETVMNWSLLDPSRWGWTACGGISNVQSPDHIQPAPKMVATIVVEFPLEHHSPDEDDNLPSADRPLATFRDAISWDLSDPETPSPMAFAMSISQEWGLPFAPTMDLAASIELQIDAHVAQHCQFTQPVTLRDPNGQERDKLGPLMQAYRYDPIVRTGKEGILRPAMAKRNDSTKQSTGGVGSSGTSLLPLDHERNAFSKQAHQQRGKQAHMGSASKSTKKAPPHVLAAASIPKVDAKYSNEIKKRLCQASTTDTQERRKNGLFMLEKIKDTQCHICHKKKDVVFGFGCGLRKHLYCKFHVETRLGLEADEAGEYFHETCPVCTLKCTCALCTRKLWTLSAAFKASCEAQRTSPNMTNFPDILTKAQSSESSREIRTIHKTPSKTLSRNTAYEEGTHALATAAPFSPSVSKGLAKGLKIRRMVPQPPISDFPQEFYNGSDLELQMPEWTDDYFTVFSTAGRQLVDSLPDAWIQRRSEDIGAPLSDPTGISEDGNLAFCHRCQAPGSLVFCDSCPRAFHAECLKEKEQQSSAAMSDSQWECPVCAEERLCSDDDIVDGKQHVNLICGAFVSTQKEVSDNLMQGIQVLSMVYELVRKLMDYDFGVHFNKPVDPQEVKGYRAVVRNPIDIGTVSTHIVDGTYAKLLEQGKSLDDVISAILKDIHLCFHNCMLFNAEGSSVYRMAEVLQRRAHQMQRKSFDQFLSQKVKDGLKAYHQSCLDDRQKTSRPGNTKLDAGMTKADALRMWKPSSARKPLIVKIMRLSALKPVALLDPVSRRVVKIYGSIYHASKAIEMMHQTAYPCEYNFPGMSKKLLQKSAVDPYKLIFGYRWLYLEDLRAGKVVFLSPRMPMVDAKILKKDLVTGSMLAGFQDFMEAHLDWKKSLLSSPTVAVEESKLSMDHFEAEYLNGKMDVDGVVWFMNNKMAPEPKFQPYPPSQAEVPSTSSNEAEAPGPQAEQALEQAPEPITPAQGEMDDTVQDEAIRKRKRNDDEGGGTLEVLKSQLSS